VMSQSFIIASARLLNRTGLHARPSVKLTQLAKRFAASVELATGADGPWVNAKSPVKVMAFQAETGASLYIRAEGEGAQEAVAALVSLIEDNFGESHADTDGAHHG